MSTCGLGAHDSCSNTRCACVRQNAIDGYVMSLGADAEGRLGPLEVAPPSLNNTQRAWAEWGAVFPVAAYHHNKCAACWKAAPGHGSFMGLYAAAISRPGYILTAAAADPNPDPDRRFYDAVGPMLGLLMAMCLVFPLSMLVRCAQSTSVLALCTRHSAAAQWKGCVLAIRWVSGPLIYAAIAQCRGVVEEKENRAREIMCIMGLQPWALNAAWAATYASILAIVSLTVAIVCKLSFLPRTDPR